MDKKANYQEGTWTITMYGSSTAGTQSYNQQTGQYYRVQQLVFTTWYLDVANKGSTMAGSVMFGGLPFTNVSVRSACSIQWLSLVNTGLIASADIFQQLYGGYNGSTTIGLFFSLVDGNSGTVSTTGLNNSGVFQGSMAYKTNAS